MPSRIAEHARPLEKLRLAARVWIGYAAVRRRLHRQPLPALVAALDAGAGLRAPRHPPARLARAVDRALRAGRRRPTCLVSSLVLYRLLRAQGDAPALVIGLRPGGPGRAAHAWVELGGRDVGPPPGRGDHVELARFP